MAEVQGNIIINQRSLGGSVPSGKRTLSGTADPVGKTVVYDAIWGEITGAIGDQEDLQIELQERDNEPLTVQEIEKILYLN